MVIGLKCSLVLRINDIVNTNNNDDIILLSSTEIITNPVDINEEFSMNFSGI